MLGFALRDACPRDVQFVATDLEQLDITDPASVAAVMGEHRPDAVLNAAAYTNVDGCEEHEPEALGVNGVGAGHLAAACAAAAVPLLHVSTDYVFDGRIPAPGEYSETDRTGPLSAYGRTKLAGEQAVAAAGGEHWITRTQWLYGLGGRNFVETMLALGAERPFLEVVDDQVGSPTSTHALAPILWDVLRRRPPSGVYHVTNAGSCSWFGFAREIFERAGLTVDLRPMTSDRLDRPASRPERSVLSNAKLRAAIDHAPGPWQQALDDYLERRKAVEATS